VRLRDRYADHGLISVVFGREDDGRLILDAWLMSCRVLGRGVEHLVFNYLLETARRRNLVEIVGTYKPTGRNALVKDHYAGLGFQRVSGDDAAELWVLDPQAAAPLETFITASAPS
jgi:FkbH-like protein